MQYKNRYINNEGINLLASAVIEMAAKDYRYALQILKIKPLHEKSVAVKNECEEFFTSEYFETLTDLNGKVLMQDIRKLAEFDNAEWQKAAINAGTKLFAKVQNGEYVQKPCKVGDVLYSIPFDDTSEIFKHTVTGFRLLVISKSEESDYIETDFAWFGENAFTSHDEAEKHLQEKRG